MKPTETVNKFYLHTSPEYRTSQICGQLKGRLELEVGDVINLGRAEVPRRFVVVDFELIGASSIDSQDAYDFWDVYVKEVR